jgi:uncharacterized protein involved in exopolysaccharide biosynthesis
MNTKSKKYFEDLPLHELLEVDESKLTLEEARTYFQVIQANRNTPQKRRAKTKKESNKLTGKNVLISDMDDLLQG